MRPTYLYVFFFSLACPALSMAADPASKISQGAILDSIPFDPQSTPGRIVLDLAKDGSPSLPLILDTGANLSVLTPGLARQIGVSVRRSKTTPYRRATRLGRDLQFYVDARRSDTRSPAGFEYGVLGSDFLDDYVLEIDFEERRVRFFDPAHYRVPDQANGLSETVLPMTLGGTRAFVELEVEGQPLKVLIDTGAPDTLIVSGQALAKLGIEWRDLPELAPYHTSRGEMQVRRYDANQLEIGKLGVTDKAITVAPHGWHNLAGSKDSALGIGLLQDFLVRIDYPRRRLWLRRGGS
ncbi:retroviral-like aspartic protease family protein [Myxococcota bacterium]|nr:retroviral-like aspartic protease family protein [Myxococcota bacterium]